MNGNNSQTKEQFLSSLGNPRKVELAEILFSEDANKIDTALAAGFNMTIIQEMARDIRKGVVDHETFTLQGNGAMKKAEAIENPVEQVEQSNEPQNETENQTVESVDPGVADSAVETEVATEESNVEVSSEGVQQGAEDTADAGTTNEESVEEPKA